MEHKQASLLKWTKGGHKNPLTRARGLGAGHGAVHHWLMQRLASVLAVPLTFWLCYSITQLVHADYNAFIAWQAAPLNALLMILTIITFFYHAAHGVQAVIEDYVHHEAYKVFKLGIMRIVMFTSAVACIFAVLKIAL
jgi:succinate dehydrogenase / fumarate reductase, membrane anchor subunit